MGLKEIMTGAASDRIPDPAFRWMSVMLAIRDFLARPDRMLDEFGIKPGDTVVDYGCGPGGYIRKASGLVGPRGTLYAVDLHELAIESVEKKIRKFGLGNVKTALIKDYSTGLGSGIADLVYALDMFHMVINPGLFLREIHRIVKKSGRLILNDGHQPRTRTMEKVKNSGIWEIVEETRGWLVCRPL